MPKVLIVEDDLDIQKLIARTLQRAGYEVAVAGDGVGAISAARKAAPDAIILDIGLPAGDGYSVLDRLQRLAPLALIPVIVLTARASVTDEQVEAAGGHRLIHKPFAADDLLAAVGDVLES